MKKAYLDNASTTAMRPEVIEEMTRIMHANYGNPSSTHSFGRGAKVVVETARKQIAACINADAKEIIFTSGGTEANNWIIKSAVKDLGVQRVITSKIEHHSVLHTVEAISAETGIKAEYVNLLPTGEVDINHLETLLAKKIPTLVSLMHVNNETGTVLDIENVGNICREYNAYFHTDSVQSIGKEYFDLKSMPIDFLVASAHKFHGPKGVGFAYVKRSIPLQPIIHGGEQEKGLRAGTEPIHQIAGMAKALELSYRDLEREKDVIKSLKNYFIEQLEIHFPGYKINGNNTFYNIINVLLPFSADKTAMILFHLDMKGVAVSRGSACQSGSIKPSHVLKELLTEEDINKPSLRVSFSHYNAKEDVDQLIEGLLSLK